MFSKACIGHLKCPTDDKITRNVKTLPTIRKDLTAGTDISNQIFKKITEIKNQATDKRK